MFRLVGRTDHHLTRDFAVQVQGHVLFEAVERLGAAFATVTHVGVLNGDPSVRGHVLLDAPRARASLRVWLGILRDNLLDSLQRVLDGRLLRRKALLLREPIFPPLHLLQDQA